MTTRSKYLYGTQRMFDDGTQEVVEQNSPLQFIDDLVGASLVIPAAGSAESGMSWVKKIVGAAPPTIAGVSNAAGGQVACTLTSTSEKQDAAFYMGDNRSFDVTKGLIFEARVQLSVLPSAAGVQAVWGLAANWIDGPDNNTQYLQFGATANGAILCRSQDGTTQTSAAAVGGKTLLTTDYPIFRIEVDPSNGAVHYFIDGVEVTPAAGVTFAGTGANAILQPYFAMYKPSGVGVGTLTFDYCKVWANRV